MEDIENNLTTELSKHTISNLKQFIRNYLKSISNEFDLLLPNKKRIKYTNDSDSDIIITDNEDSIDENNDKINEYLLLENISNEFTESDEDIISDFTESDETILSEFTGSDEDYQELLDNTSTDDDEDITDDDEEDEDITDDENKLL